MRISEVLKASRPCYSFEFFPPKDQSGFDKLFETIGRLKPWNPGFVSVTYGAGGSTRSKTVDLVGRIKNEIGIESMAHLTCVGSSAGEIRGILDNLKSHQIENILALRGDPPQGQESFQKAADGFAYANELVTFIKKTHNFCLGVAGYPEGHMETPDRQVDLENLKRKVDCGADFIVTQLFFDNRFYFDFVERAVKAGIHVPIVPGIMPILNFGQIKRFTEMCGVAIPAELIRSLESHQEDAQAVRDIGIEYATRQCEDLVTRGAPGIHFYTLNLSKATLGILENLKIAGKLCGPSHP
jgi:methylenetetrahydrofolate reductase (NADPH)